MTARLLTICLTVVLSLGVFTRASYAQGDKAKQQAAKYFADGEREFTLGRFDAAIKNYKLGFEAYPDQWFLFNIAQSYRQMGDCKNAIFFYKRYLSFAKRPESSRKRKAEVEKEVNDVFIPELEDKCTRDAAIKDRPPDFVEGGGENKTPPDNGGNTDNAGNATKTDGNGTKADGTKTDGTTNGTRTAQTDDDDFGDDDDDDDDDDIIITTPGEKATLFQSSVGLGPAFLGVGSELNVPAQFSMAIGAGYPLQVGPAVVAPGVMFTYTPVPWENAGESGSASLTSILANVVALYEVMPKLSVRADVGLGVQLFGGLVRGNPFTLNGAEASGALGVFNLRLGVGAEYAVTKNIVVTGSPAVFSYSPAPANMRMDMSSVTRFELLFGAGYRM